MHFIAIYVELGEEAHVWIYIVRSHIAPLSQEICYVSVIEIIATLHIISKGGIDCETLFSIVLSQKLQLL